MRPSWRNILAVYALASDAQIDQGMRWYAEANALARELDPDNPSRAAGVIAALSPMIQWERNVALARHAYAHGTASGALGNSVRAANDILAGKDPLDVLHGPKVRAFYLAISDPDNDDVLVIDRHSYAVAVGHTVSDYRRKPAIKRESVRDAVTRAYRRAAKHLGISLATLQATTWIVWRDANRWKRS